MNDRAPFRRFLPAAAVLCTGGLVLSAAPASAEHAPEHLYALEVFAPHGEPVPEAPCGESIAIDGMADAADLPAGTTAAIALRGPLQKVTGDGTCTTWWIGGYPVAAPFTSAPDAPAGTEVRVVGAAVVAPSTKIVASKLDVREDRTSVGPADLELAYLAAFTITRGDLVVDVPLTGDCVELPEDVWTVEDEQGGAWELDVAAARSAGEVEPCFQAGDDIEAEFDLAPPETEGGGLIRGLLPAPPEE